MVIITVEMMVGCFVEEHFGVACCIFFFFFACAVIGRAAHLLVKMTLYIALDVIVAL